MKGGITLVVTGACNRNCFSCSQEFWRADYRDYHMSVDEVKTACRRIHELDLNYGAVRLVGGEPTLWKNFEEGCRALRASGTFRTIDVCTNGDNRDMLERALKTRLIDSVNGSRRFLAISKTHPARYHKRHPDTPMDGVLPADCNCDRPAIFDGRVYACAAAYSHARRIASDPNAPGTWCALDGDWKKFLREYDKYNAEVCRACLANLKVWRKIKKTVPVETEK